MLNIFLWFCCGWFLSDVFHFMRKLWRNHRRGIATTEVGINVVFDAPQDVRLTRPFLSKLFENLRGIADSVVSSELQQNEIEGQKYRVNGGWFRHYRSQKRRSGTRHITRRNPSPDVEYDD